MKNFTVLFCKKFINYLISIKTSTGKRTTIGKLGGKCNNNREGIYITWSTRVPPVSTGANLRIHVVGSLVTTDNVRSTLFLFRTGRILMDDLFF